MTMLLNFDQAYYKQMVVFFNCSANYNIRLGSWENSVVMIFQFARSIALAGFTLLCAIIFTPVFAHAECYTYDDLGRLISVVYDNDGAMGDNAKRSYVLDKHGNRKSVSEDMNGGGGCTQPSGDETTGADNSASGSGDMLFAVEVNASITVTPYVNGTWALTSYTNSTPTLITVTQPGTSLQVTAGASATTSGNSATITFNGSDGMGSTDSGTISIAITAIGGASGDPCTIDPSLPGCGN